MQLHNLKAHSTHKKTPRIGRGGKRGKTSGKGMKGQTARTGNSTRPELRDMIKKLPKRRGFGKNRARTVNNERARALVVNVGTLETMFQGGDINPQILSAKGLIKIRGNVVPLVKILGEGTLSKKFTVSGCVVSKSAREKIVAAQGTVV